LAPGFDFLVEQQTEIFGAQMAQIHEAWAGRSGSGFEARSHSAVIVASGLGRP
jgi:hypothetical protein